MGIKILGLDMALSNAGIAMTEYNAETNTLGVIALELVKTKPSKDKKRRRNLDDLSRILHIIKRVRSYIDDCDVIIAEIPTGAQSSRAAFAFGMVLGALASFMLDKEIIPVMPTDRGMAILNVKSVSKEEVIDWAVNKYPHANWPRLRDKADGRITNDAEHLADALAIIHARIKKSEFQKYMKNKTDNP